MFQGNNVRFDLGDGRILKEQQDIRVFLLVEIWGVSMWGMDFNGVRL